MTSEAVPTISISVRHLHAVERHAAETYPAECCGFLLGEVAAGGEAPHDNSLQVRVERILPARNERRDEEAGHGYLIAPETVLAARREARSVGLQVVGYYHSHPDSSAEPSERDLRDAWPGMSYLIVSLDGGAPVTARSWRLRRDRRGFIEEVVAPLGDPSLLRSLELASGAKR